MATNPSMMTDPNAAPPPRTGAEHYGEAQRLLIEAADATDDIEAARTALAAAQVHASLATAAAVVEAARLSDVRTSSWRWAIR